MTSPGRLMPTAVPTTASPDSQSVETPRSVLVALRLGGTVSLIAIAVISFDVLTDLGRQAGLHRLAELFPIAVDAFAASTLYAAYRLPGAHPARALAKRTARSALALTVFCNVLDHLLVLAGFIIPAIVRDLVLVAVASLPQLVADRELHLLVAVTAHAPRNLVADPGSDVHSEPNDQDESGSAERSVLTARDETWLKVGAPIYQGLQQRDGRRPTERAFHEALTQQLAARTGHVDGLDGQRDSFAFLGDKVSLSTAKRIRALVESRGEFLGSAAEDDASDEAP